MMESFWTNMANHLWQTSGLILLLLGLERAMRLAPGRWLERLWLVALAALIVPVGWLSVGIPWSRPTDLETARVIWTLPEQAVEAGSAQTGASSFWIVLTVIWLAGFLYHWILLARNFWKLQQWKDHSLNSLNDADRLNLLQLLQIQDLSAAQVRWTNESQMPMVVGLWRPRIVLPLALIRTMDSDQLLAVLLHEDSHRRRRDPLRLLAYSIIQSVLFFHPLWPLVQRRLKDTSEFICDENSLASGLTGHRYAQALANALALNLKSPHLSVAAGLRCRTSLSARISRFNLKERKTNMLRYRLLLSLALGLLISGMLISVGFEADSLVVDSAVAGVLIENDQLYLSNDEAESNEAEDSEDMTNPKVTFWAKPDYPDVCRKEGITGKVFIKVLVDAEGNVKKTEVMKGPECLQEAALEAAKKCRFDPAVKSGKKVEAWMAIPYVFKLH